ncbi:PglZ domain-containing protein [Eisenibacter elegans]|jgi:CheY-like chemotaxis protein|uniref:T9SS response regulator signal transducer PorX n=1 Tax=Eisenibacter elegans TaxID=997 RepID=UPI000408F587|nr:PglZ domain-containing protein [Eisenibacter elegans]
METIYHILWADDEIDLLKPHILFLGKKGYKVTPVNSGTDALDQIEETSFDLIFLDENMPGMTGLETLTQIKQRQPNVPIVMITKSEEEHIMEEAIGANIADYLIKPINPNQIILSIKKILDNQRIRSEKTQQNYQQDFRNLMMAFGERTDYQEWTEIYKKLVFWELEIESSQSQGMQEVLEMQKNEANTNFVKFIEENYEEWLANPQDEDTPLLSHHLVRSKVLPFLQNNEPVFFIVIDNLRYDQWKVIEPMLAPYFHIEEESIYYSILPTTTAYARNALFSGLTPLEMSRKHPDLWVEEGDEEGKNLQEAAFLEKQLQRLRHNIRFEYHKIIHQQKGKQVTESLNQLMGNQLNALVYNFVDMLSHARTDVAMIRELMPDDAAFRSLTKSWFAHSPLFDLLKKLSDKKAKVILTTDHGTVFVKRPFKIIGDRNVNTNLRYKQGKNLNYDGDKVLVARKPEAFHLPKVNLSTSYVFAVEDYFFAYPNNYNHYVNYYRDTFQHGGVSMEEIMIPFVVLAQK